MKLFTNIISKNKRQEIEKYPYGSDEFGKYLKEAYTDSVDEITTLEEDLYEKIQDYDEIVYIMSELEKKKKVIEHMFKDEIKNYETAFCKDRKITWKKVIKNTVDTKKLKEDYPDIVNSYIKSTTSRVFKIK